MRSEASSLKSFPNGFLACAEFQKGLRIAPSGAGRENYAPMVRLKELLTSQSLFLDPELTLLRLAAG
jgi:hypothetical protein